MTLLELINLLKKHLKLVVLLPLACALAMGMFSMLFMSNTYTATTSMYVLVKNNDSGNSSTLYSDLNASQMVTNDVATLLNSDRVTNETAKDLGLQNLKAYKVSVTSETTSRVIALSVTGTDPEGAARVADTMAQKVSSIAQEVMDVQSINVIDQAGRPRTRVAPTACCTPPWLSLPASLRRSRSLSCPTCSTPGSVTRKSSRNCWVSPSSGASPRCKGYH